MSAPRTPSSDETPRLECRIVRAWCAWSGRDATRHIACCASCQRYFHSLGGLERELREEARRESARVASGHLEQRILRTLRSAHREAPAKRGALRGSTWALAGCATLAAFAVLMLGPARHPALPVPRTSTNEDAAAIASLIKSASAELVETVIPSAGQLVAENPLQRELGLVYSDVQSALDFLALNFSPGSADAKPASPRTI